LRTVLGVTVTEEALRQATAALARAERPGRRHEVLGLPAATQEVAAWLADPHQATNVLPTHWKSLLGDLSDALSRCGTHLTAALSSEADLAAELSACRQALSGDGRAAPDASLRRRIERVSDHLASAINDADVRVAAFQDLLTAPDLDSATEAGETLLAVLDAAGFEKTWYPQRLRSLLAGHAHAVAAERGEPMPSAPMDDAGAAAAELAVLAIDRLRKPPVRDDVVVWMRFVHAALIGRPELSLGEGVVLYQDRWLRETLNTDPDFLSVKAPEAIAAGADLFELRLFAGADTGFDEVTQPEAREAAGLKSAHVDVGTDETEDETAVFLRVAVSDATIAEARGVARRTADVLSGLASLYGTPARLWELDESYVALSEQGSSSSFGAAPTVALAPEDWGALDHDRTLAIFESIGERLGQHLPVRDPEIAHAATLLSWLRRARLTDGPPRLLLCDRVVEQVSGWAGFGSPRRFTSDYLAVAWALRRMRNEIQDAAFAAAHELRSLNQHELATTFAEGASERIDLRAFLQGVDAILEAVRPQGIAQERVRLLLPHLRTPKTSRAWLRTTTETFQTLESRRLRTRNTVVHGGPVHDSTVDSIVGFAESLAVQALGATIDGRLENKPLVDHFLDERESLESVGRRLDSGEPLSAALFYAQR
jgi:hypothetical protein